MRIMGLDIGVKNIGVAISDESGILAQGRGVVNRISNTRAVETIKEMLDEFNVKEIVVGLPINMNGTKGPRAEDSEKFAGMLKEYTHLSVKFWDERLSTKEVEDVMIKADVSRQKRKKLVDKMAAQLILQGYLDSLGKGLN